MVHQLIEEFETSQPEPLYIQLMNRASLKQQQQQNRYWDIFYRQFSDFLYYNKKYYDTYSGAVFKTVETFFNWLSIERSIPVGNFHKRFRVPLHQTVPVVLSPQQLRFLIRNESFENSLSGHLKRTKDIFVFGCTVGLRYGDLMRLKTSNLFKTDHSVMLSLVTQKTGVSVLIPLPDYAVAIINKYKKKCGRYLLPRLSSTNINLQLKKMMELAGFTQPFPKIRYRKGKALEIKRNNEQSWRFCDHITAHTMRRTAITSLLMLGVPETMVRKISGHAGGSREFYRYVSLAQDYLTEQIKQAHQRLLNGE